MKRFLTLTAAACLAFPLLAEEPKKAETKSETKTAAKIVSPAPATPAPAPAVVDSPMVAAAKRANRLGKKPVSNVITNETLEQMRGGHITTTETQRGIAIPPPPPAPAPTPEMAAAAAVAKKRAEEARLADKQKKTDTDKKAVRERTAVIVEDDQYAEEHPPEYSQQQDPAPNANEPRRSENTSTPKESKPQR
jgi:hypothetical protein